MEAKSFKLIPVSQIGEEAPYGFRFKEEDLLLESSLAKRGMLFPALLISQGSRFVVVSGHKRLFYARRLQWKEIPAILILDPWNPKELFLLSLYSNWNEKFSELDQMLALRKAREEFGFSPKELQEDVLPVLGLAPSRSLLERYRAVSKLAKELQSLIHERRIPFQDANSLSRFSQDEQTLLARSVFNGIHLTSNQLRLISEWLADLKKIRNSSLEALLKEEPLAGILSHTRMDARTRGERFFSALRALRFPRVSEAKAAFERFKSRMGSSEEIQWEPPEGLESEGLFLRARFRKKDAVARVIQFLENHQKTLESYL